MLPLTDPPQIANPSSITQYTSMRIFDACSLIANRECMRRGDKARGRDVWLHQICSGSGIALQGPKPRAKSPALQARLAELQKKLEQHQYDVMLQGIAEKVHCHPAIDMHTAASCACASWGMYTAQSRALPAGGKLNLIWRWQITHMAVLGAIPGADSRC